MRFTLNSLRCLAVMLILLPGLAGSVAIKPTNRADFFVATNGNDEWSGTLSEPNSARRDGPFATLARARDAVHEAKGRSHRRNYQVLIRAGRYQLDETLVFGMADSAPNGGRITYGAFPGETPVISSGVPLTGWRRLNPEPASLPAAARGKVWVADVPRGLDRILTLYDGPQRLPRARGTGFTPEAFAKPDARSDEIILPSGTLKNYPDQDDAELVIIPSCDYELNILPLGIVDESNHLARTLFPASRPIAKVKYFDTTIWLENVLEALDQPGEWVFHSDERKIYFWPTSDKPGDEIFAPKLTELIRVEGDIDYDGPADRCVTGLAFRGLTFSHAERYPWHGGTGWTLQHSWEIFDRPTAVVRFRGAANCSVEACRFTSSSGTGLRLDLTCRRNRIAGNEFSHLGSMAILCAGYGPGTKDENRANEITNNWVHHTSEIYQAAPAIMIWQSGENHIANNLIHNTPYSGIAISGRMSIGRGITDADGSRTVRWNEMGELKRDYNWYEWYYYEKFLHARKNLVEHNEIHHVMETMGDGNGIYISGSGGGNHIFENYVHDCVGPHMGGGIRCDDFQNETIVEGNIISHIASVQVGVSVTGRNHIVNNIIVDIFPSVRPLAPSKIVHGYICLPSTYPYGVKDHFLDLTGMRIERNIVLSLRPDYLPVLEHKSFSTGPGDRLKGTKTDRNLYWCPADPQWGERYLQSQRANHVEQHSCSADPIFLDWKNGDFRLQPGSPASKLGFKPIDLSIIGLQR